MPLPGIRAAKSFLDELQRDLLETEDQDIDGFFDRWKVAGLPEIEEYRGERRRSRGEMISETTKIGRAIEKRPKLLQEEDTGESPILTGVKRIARGAERFQGLMENATAAQPFTARGNTATLDRLGPAGMANAAGAPTLIQVSAPGAASDAISPTAEPFADTGNADELTGSAPAGTATVPAGRLGLTTPLAQPSADGLLANPSPDQPDDENSGSNESFDPMFLSAKQLSDEAAAEFQARTGFELDRTKDGFRLTDPTGNELFELSRETAGELARIWTPEIARRAVATGVIWHEDLSPEERRLLVEEIVAEDLRAAKALNANTLTIGPAGEFASIRQRAFEQQAVGRLAAYDALIEALERDAPDEELQDRIDDWQEAILPEIFGSGRIIRDLIMDLMPGLGNIRSIRHLENDFAELDRAVETGEWGDAAFASGMAILDIIGIIPGGNILKTGVRGVGKRAKALIRPLGGNLPGKLKARYHLAKFIKSGKANDFRSSTAEDYFASVWDRLAPEIQVFLDKRFHNFVGTAGEKVAGRTARDAGFDIANRKSFDLPKGMRTSKRNFDHVLSEEIKESLFSILAVPGKRVKGTGVEVKVAKGKQTAAQKAANNALLDAGEISSVAVLQVPASRIKADDLAEVVTDWLNNSRRKNARRPGGVPRAEVEKLIEMLREQRGPDGLPLTIGQVMMVAASFALPFAFPIEDEDMEDGLIDLSAAMP